MKPDAMGEMRARSVSPVGASRFEQPFIPASSKHASPTTPTSAVDSHFDHLSSHHPLPPHHTTTMTTDPPSTTSRFTTPAASTHTDDADADAWFARFRSDPDLTSPSMALAGDADVPDRATLAAVYDIPVYGADGAAMPFGSLYDPAYALHPRQLIIFVRHFYCGACQAYLKALSASITKEDYFAIPVPTSIVVVGCGQPDLIRQYKKFTACPFPIYAEPTRAVFKKLGMSPSLKIGAERPEYMREISTAGWLAGQAKTISASLKDPEGIRKRDVVRGGNPMQVGGEFLFDEGSVAWCHRMRHYRNHAEVAVVRQVLGLDE